MKQMACEHKWVFDCVSRVEYATLLLDGIIKTEANTALYHCEKCCEQKQIIIGE